MATTEQKTVLALRVLVEEENPSYYDKDGSIKILAEVVEVHPSEGETWREAVGDPRVFMDRVIRNPDYRSPLSSLQVYSQGSGGEWRGRGVYAWAVEYRSPYTVDLERAEAMVKQLRHIERSLAKAAERDGQARSYGQYCLRVARAIGAQMMCWARDQRSFHTYDEMRWTFVSLPDGANHIDGLVREWIERPERERQDREEREREQTA